jgi:hypothetical protein
MRARWILAGVLGAAGLGGLYMAAITWSEPDGGGWLFLAFAALLLLLAFAAARPAKTAETPSTRFVPAWFFDGAILVMAILVLVAIASCMMGRK